MNTFSTPSAQYGKLGRYFWTSSFSKWAKYQYIQFSICNQFQWEKLHLLIYLFIWWNLRFRNIYQVFHTGFAAQLACWLQENNVYVFCSEEKSRREVRQKNLRTTNALLSTVDDRSLVTCTASYITLCLLRKFNVINTAFNHILILMVLEKVYKTSGIKRGRYSLPRLYNLRD